MKQPPLGYQKGQIGRELLKCSFEELDSKELAANEHHDRHSIGCAYGELSYMIYKKFINCIRAHKQRRSNGCT